MDTYPTYSDRSPDAMSNADSWSESTNLATSLTDRPRVVSACAPSLQPLSEFPDPFRQCAVESREKYAALYEMPVIEHPDGTRTFHQGVAHRVHGLNVLFLKGDLFEMAFQHGRLLFDQIPRGAVVQSSRMVANCLSNALGLGSCLTNMLASGVDRWITHPMIQHSISMTRKKLGKVEGLQDAVALAESTGLPVNTLIRAICNPETMLLLAKFTNNAAGHPVRLLDGVLAPHNCCSSFAAWDSATCDGDMIIGRNMDYPMNGTYDQFPTVVYYEPTERGQRYMTCVSAGIQNGGLNAINESGIFLASHTVPSDHVAIKGVPVFTTANQVIRLATSFETAVEMFRWFRPPTGWSYLIVSTNERRVGTVEMNNRNVVLRESTGNSHVQTNHFLDHAMQASHMFLNTSVCEDNDGRYLRLRQRLDEATGQIDVRHAISMLSDQVDPLVNEVRGLGSTVAVHTNMTSMVVEPDKGRVWVSNGQGPACHGEFIELPLVGTVAADEFEPIDRATIKNESFRQEHPEMWAGLQSFISAKRAYENENDCEGARDHLADAIEHDRSNPSYFFQLAIFQMKTDQHADAVKTLDAMAECPYLSPQLQRLGHYYRGRAYAHIGQRSEALDALQNVVDDPRVDAKLRAAAKRAYDRTRFRGRCRLARRSLAIMMQQTDMVSY